MTTAGTTMEAVGKVYRQSFESIAEQTPLQHRKLASLPQSVSVLQEVLVQLPNVHLLSQQRS